MTTAPTSPTPEPSTYTLAGGDGAAHLDGLGGDLNGGAVVGDGDVVPGQAHVLGQLAVDLEHPLLAVDGDEEPGLGQGVDDLQLLLAGVAGDMEDVRLVVDHLHALAEELVDDPGHRDLVAGDGGGGDDDPCRRPPSSTCLCWEKAMRYRALISSPWEPVVTMTCLFFGRPLDLVDVHQGVLGHLHIPQLRGDLHHVLHAAAP